ncbi:GntR family transcriptional regulator/MocR family aminotransferase [Bradyrhizobium elkanii]|uniref:MocR-like pyridoxine biosynthesis transcription factor PdxR n=1 Tax=Bradyrhizobium elkanii TaxID=29448 RepID=UPI0035118D7E
MQLPIDIEKRSDISLQDQIMTRVRELILHRKLVPGTKLPSSRDFSKQLDVSRNTVIYAYDRLVSEGYLEVKGRSGMFVSAQIPENALNISTCNVGANARAFSLTSKRLLPVRHRSPLLYQRLRERIELDFRIGRPAASSFPERLWTRLLVEKMAGSGRRMTEYGNPAGLEELRVAISDHLQAARGINAHPDQIIVVAGCEEGLNIIAKILTPAGSTVYVENPCYKGVPFVFESYGAKVVPIPIDSEGLCVDRLATRERGIVCVTPSHQFPIGVTMSLSRRLKLLDWVNSAGTYIVEDDYDSDFRYDGSPLTALAGLDKSGSVIYIGTFSKSIGAGLRVGYLVVPEELIGPTREAKALLNNGNPWLEQAVIAEFLASGGFRKHLRQIRQTYLKRRNTLLEQLRLRFGNIDILGEEGGMHLTWVLPKTFSNARAIQYECLHRGVGIYSIDDSPAIDFDNTHFRERAVFFGYPCLSEGEIVTAVGRLADAAADLG